jgi:CRISPR-associated exonuclease Cas4
MFELRVSDIKQFLYCPRIIYFTYVCPVQKKTTRKMEFGKEEHLVLDRLEKRRTFKRYNLTEARRIFHLPLRSTRLGLSGLLDLHIQTADAYFPLEFKFTTAEPALNHKYQLMAYAMLLEEHVLKTIRYGFLYLTPQNRIIPVPITDNGREFVLTTLQKIRRMIAREEFPTGSRKSARCTDCEFRNYCRDVR